MPKLSVVVPWYNVQDYLQECLESLARQSVTDIEVILVDDGSNDESPKIAQEFAERDPRFKLVRQDNEGPGAARNNGIAHATGQYLAFADGDDIIPTTAFELLIASLERTGSDFALGNALRLTPNGTHQSALHSRYARRSRECTHISRDHELMHDRVVWGRVYRRAFWTEHQEMLRFPEGVLHEDIEPAILAHYLAASVDVVHDTVYLWRIRDAGAASTTQRRTDVNILRDRFAAVDGVSRFLAEHATAEEKRAWDRVAISSDLRIFLKEVDEADDEFRTRLLDLANGFLGRADDSVVDQLPAIQRLEWHFVRHRQLDELIEVARFERQGKARQIVREGLRWYGDYPYRGDASVGVPDSVYRLRGRELRIRPRIHDFAWKDGRLEVDATAYIAPLGPISAKKSRRIAVLVRGDRRRLIPLRTRSRFDSDQRPEPGADPFGCDPSAFGVSIDPRWLKVRGRWEDVSWQLGVGVLYPGLFRKGRLAHPLPGTAQSPPPHYVATDVRVVPRISPAGALQLRVENVRASVAACQVVGDRFEILGRLRGPAARRPPRTALLHLRRRGGAAVVTYPVEFQASDPTSFTARVPFADMFGENDAAAEVVPSLTHLTDTAEWQVGLLFDDAEDPVRIVMDNPRIEASAFWDGTEIRAVRSRYGYLTVSVRKVVPVVTSARWDARGVLRLGGEYRGSADTPELELVLRAGPHVRDRVFPLIRSDDGFTVEIPAAAVPSAAGELPLPEGRWTLRARTSGDESILRPLRIDHQLLDQLPTQTRIADRRYVFSPERYDMAAIMVYSSLRPDERGPWWQRRLQHGTYASARSAPLRDAVLFDSYKGRQYSDNPRAVHEELVRRGVDLELLWVVEDDQVELPSTARPVRMFSAEWYEAAARCKYIVSNMFLPTWYRPRDGQRFIQTWHGTPLKRLGYDVDVPGRDLAVLGGLDRVSEAASTFSALVSPNPFSTPIFRRAFRYDGEIIESGYPRNDVLYSEQREQIVARVRERLGLPEGKRTVLYAPTWREDQAVGSGRYRLDLRLDLDRARDALADDHVLLIRAHNYVTARIPGDGGGISHGRSDRGGRFVFDVSDYPDIAELYLASDVLVTDYSSSMFDFANTRRPMLFFTYDLAAYRDKLRGFYFDLEAESPGPLVSESDELIEAIANAESVRADFRDRYDAFVAKFCSWDDGKAAARVVDHMLA